MQDVAEDLLKNKLELLLLLFFFFFFFFLLLLDAHADTQLGAFGPGADPTRSRAAYPAPCLAVSLFIFC